MAHTDRASTYAHQVCSAARRHSAA